MTPLFEGILAVLAIVALAAGVMFSASVPLELPVSPVSIEYETN
jgi:hypothetical protein